MEKQWIKIKDVAKMLDINTMTLYRWCRIGKIPHYKMIGSVKFDKAEIEKWIEEKKVNIKGRWKKLL